MGNARYYIISIKEFQNYMGYRSRKTASKYYKVYLKLVGKRDCAKLSLADIALLDDLTPEQIKERL